MWESPSPMSEPAAASVDEVAAEAAPGLTPVSDETQEVSPDTAREEVLVLDFGGQYSQLIARRIRECGVFSELLPHDTPLEKIKERAPKGLVLSGGPASVYSEGAPRLRKELLELRSEERRVGKECRSGWSPYQSHKHTDASAMS